jgi:ankyrin repeat protein
MTEPTPGRDRASGPAPEAGQAPAHDPEVLQLAAQVFDLARQGDTDRLAAYVDAGVPVNLTNDRGDTLLMLAAYHGHACTVRALLERGAEADRTNDRGQTPLAGAVFKGEREVIAALVEAGADPAAGAPSAVDTARVFGRDELLALFGSA